MAPPRIAEQIGRVLGGRYRLVAPLGTGASAHVYVADDVKLRRRVAVKVLHPALASDETFLRRFRAEAQSVAALRHPHVLQVFDWGEDDDGPWLVLEYLSGGSLRDLLDRGVRLTPSQAVLVGLQAAQGLEYAHRRGLVHRDIKPANLLFDDEGRLVIADFGLARALAEAAWTEPAGGMAGTARYASPEQAKQARVDGKADVYALALVLVEAVTGQVPFAADTMVATLMARVERSLEAPPELHALAPAIEAAGAADREERADASTFIKLLDECATELPRPAPLPIEESHGSAVPRLERDADELTILPPSTATVTPIPAGGHPAPRLFDDEAAPPPVHDPAADDRPSRRWLRRIALLVVVLALLGGAGIAIAASGITKPSHPVPSLSGLTLVQASREVADENFEVRQTRVEFDETVPKGQIKDQSPLASDSMKEGGVVKVVVSNGPKPRAVPDLTGKTGAEAKALLEEQQLQYVEEPSDYSDTVPKGQIISWNPTGTAPRDSAVAVIVSKGKAPKEIPTFTDRAFDAVKKWLEDNGFLPKKEESFSDEVEKGQVIATRPEEKSQAQPGDEVVVVVSKGPELVQVPDVSGMDIATADRRLRDAGLSTEGVDGNPFRPVKQTNPRAGTAVKKGSSVTLITR